VTSTSTAQSLSKALRKSHQPAPIRYGVVQSTSTLTGSAVVRPSSAAATDGSEDVTALVVGNRLPPIGSRVMLDINQGDVVVTGTVGETGAWDTYTPTLGGTGWAVGSGTLEGFWRLLDAHTATFEVVFTLGTTLGTAGLTVSLPTPGVRATVGMNQLVQGSTRYGGVANLTTASAIPQFGPATAGGADRSMTSSVPTALAAGNVLTIAGTYEIAP